MKERDEKIKESAVRAENTEQSETQAALKMQFRQDTGRGEKTKRERGEERRGKERRGKGRSQIRERCE